MSKKRVLHMTLKWRWFDQIARRLKPNEYRDIKDYWIKRLLNSPEFDFFDVQEIPLNPAAIRQFDEIHFRNGYNPESPFMRVEWKGMHVSNRCENGEFNDHRPRFAIEMGEVLELKNYELPD